MKKLYSLECNIAQTLNLIGDRWSLLILHRLLMGIGTFKELQDNLEGIPTNLLSDRLKTMEEDGLIRSELYQEHPPRYRYALTDMGMDLHDVFNSLAIWGDKYLTACSKRIVHDTCGHRVEHRYYCPHCDVVVTAAELGIHDEVTP